MTSKVRMLTAGALIALFTFFALGSASPSYTKKTRTTTNMQPQPIKYGKLINEDLKIVSKHGKFTLNGGEQFDTPFNVYWWKNNGLTASDTAQGQLVNAYDKAARMGGQRVLVYQKGHEEPLHGILAFNTAVGSAYGPATRSYYVKIPDQKLNSARHGNIAVAYEKMNWRDTSQTRYYRNGSMYKTQDHENKKSWYSWILWLSATPI